MAFAAGIVALVVLLGGGAAGSHDSAIPAFGTVMTAGCSWAPHTTPAVKAHCSKLNVHSDGDFVWSSRQDAYGREWQCTELAARWLDVAYGAGTATEAMIHTDAKDWMTAAASDSRLVALPNGGAGGPGVGDVMVFSGGKHGHVGVVRSVTHHSVTIEEQNDGRFASTTMSLHGTTVEAPWTGYRVLGWLQPMPDRSQP